MARRTRVGRLDPIVPRGGECSRDDRAAPLAGIRSAREHRRGEEHRRGSRKLQPNPPGSAGTKQILGRNLAEPPIQPPWRDPASLGPLTECKWQQPEPERAHGRDRQQDLAIAPMNPQEPERLWDNGHYAVVMGRYRGNRRERPSAHPAPRRLRQPHMRKGEQRQGGEQHKQGVGPRLL
jgi:hypothetical protein